MKKSIAITLALAMILVLLAGCGAPPAVAETPAAPAAPAAEAPAAPAAEAPAAEANGEENWWDDINFDEEVHLIFATTGTAENGPSLGNSRAIEAIKERSNGKIIIERMAGGVLGNENSTFAQCMEGSIDMVGCGSGTVSPYTPLLDVFVLPFLIGSYEQEWAVMQSDEWQAIRQRFNEEFEGVSLLAMFDYGMRHFATIDKPVKTIDDLKGLKIRSQGNPVIDKALQLAGANPVAVSFADLYSALQNGVIDAEEVNSTTVYQQKHYEVVNYISEIGFYPYLSMCVISDKTLERLPEGYADLIFKTFAESERWYMEEYVNEWDAIGRQGCLDGGIEYNTIEDKPVWVERMQVLYDEKAAEDPMYAAFIEKALSLRQEQ